MNGEQEPVYKFFDICFNGVLLNLFNINDPKEVVLHTCKIVIRENKIVIRDNLFSGFTMGYINKKGLPFATTSLPSCFNYVRLLP